MENMGFQPLYLLFRMGAATALLKYYIFDCRRDTIQEDCGSLFETASLLTGIVDPPVGFDMALERNTTKTSTLYSLEACHIKIDWQFH